MRWLPRASGRGRARYLGGGGGGARRVLPVPVSSRYAVPAAGWRQQKKPPARWGGSPGVSPAAGRSGGSGVAVSPGPPLPAGLKRCWAAGGREGTANSALGGRALRTVLPVVVRWPGERSGGGEEEKEKNIVPLFFEGLVCGVLSELRYLRVRRRSTRSSLLTFGSG